jgi:hypothetical protein
MIPDPSLSFSFSEEKHSVLYYFTAYLEFTGPDPAYRTHSNENFIGCKYAYKLPRLEDELPLKILCSRRLLSLKSF